MTAFPGGMNNKQFDDVLLFWMVAFLVLLRCLGATLVADGGADGLDFFFFLFGASWSVFSSTK